MSHAGPSAEAEGEDGPAALPAARPGGRQPRAGGPALKKLRRLLEAYRLRRLRRPPGRPASGGPPPPGG